jgi:hypothetical protein
MLGKEERHRLHKRPLVKVALDANVIAGVKRGVVPVHEQMAFADGETSGFV